MWRHFHLNFDDDDDDDDENENDEEVDVDIRLGRNRMDNNDNDDDIKNVDEEKKKNVWFKKLVPIVEHFRNTSLSLVFTLGSNVAIDEMIIRFRGRSNETHRIKNKPIGEGYKFFVVSETDGYCLNCTPDGRIAAKNNELEYEKDRSMGKTESMILHLVEFISSLKEKQINRIRKRVRVLTRTRQQRGNEVVEVVQDKFIVTMDNYFTLPKVIAKLREKGIGVVGTSRFRKNWPSKELKCIDGEKVQFNDFFWMIDTHSTLVARWKDNGMVFLTSTVHQVGNTIERLRKKPRSTATNKNHVEAVWGNNGSTNIYIPTLVDDYNHWMGGVDMTDQLISYYHPNIRCFRTWLPMFLQILSMIRTNSFVVYKSYYNQQNRKPPLNHKQFTLAMIESLLAEADYYFKRPNENNLITSSTSTAADPINETPPQSNSTRRSTNLQQSNTPRTPSLLSFPSHSPSVTSCSSRDLLWKRSEMEQHKRIKKVSNKKDRHGKSKRMNLPCVYCSDEYKVKKSTGAIDSSIKWDRYVKRTEFVCLKCDVFLCTQHFHLYHEYLGS